MGLAVEATKRPCGWNVNQRERVKTEFQKGGGAQIAGGLCRLGKGGWVIFKCNQKSMGP